MAGKPGRPRSLTVDQIVRAALDDGLTSFSMPSVARRVGVAHSALYRYVENREALLVTAVDQALGTADWPSPDQPWDAMLRAVEHAVWTVCERTSGLDRASVNHAGAMAAWTRHLEPHTAALVAQGFTTRDADTVVGLVLRIALIGSAERDDTADATTRDARLDVVLTGAAGLRS